MAESYKNKPDGGKILKCVFMLLFCCAVFTGDDEVVIDRWQQ